MRICTSSLGGAPGGGSTGAGGSTWSDWHTLTNTFCPRLVNERVFAT